MTTNIPNTRHYGFAIGLMTGTCVGAGLMMWLAPDAGSELRKRMRASAKGLGQRAATQYDDARTGVGAAISDLSRRGQDVRDDLAASVARGAHEIARGATEVERFAMSTTGDRR